MKKSLILLLLLLTSCTSTPQQEVGPSPARKLETFQEMGLRFDYPMDWKLDNELDIPLQDWREDNQLGGLGSTNGPHVRAFSNLSQSSDCSQAYGSFTIDIWAKNPATDFGTWVKTKAPSWGGVQTEDSLKIGVDPLSNELKTVKAYREEDTSPIACSVSLSQIVIDWTPEKVLGVSMGGDPSKKAAVESILSSLRLEQTAYFKNATTTTVDLNWIGFYGRPEGNEKALLEGQCPEGVIEEGQCNRAGPLYISDPEVKYETTPVAADATVDLIDSGSGDLKGTYTWADFLKEVAKPNNGFSNLPMDKPTWPPSAIFKVTMENGALKKLTQIYTP